MRTITLSRRFIIFLLGATLILSLILFSVSAQNEPKTAVTHGDSRDKLAYVSDEGHLMLYDPHGRTETMLLEGVQDFVLGQDGRIAFTRPNENDNGLYVFDPSTSALAPINISQNSAENNAPLAWSPDGRHLAFDSYQDIDDHSLYVWNGETTMTVMPASETDQVFRFYIDWSDDGRLAFIPLHAGPDGNRSEIYLWDGSTTTRVSQNLGWDGDVSWNRNGQLMLGSRQDAAGDIYIWDGVSFKNGSPDTDSFIHVAPELNPTYPVWIEDDVVGFTTSEPKQVVLWNVNNKTVIQKFSVSSDKTYSWLADGGQVILSSQLASGIPSVYLDVENTEGEILFNTHTGQFSWSADGYLAYCGIEERFSRILSIWDGNETWVVANVSYKSVQWQYGRDTFSCNNG